MRITLGSEQVTPTQPPGPGSLASLCMDWSSTRPASLPGICQHYTGHHNQDSQLPVIRLEHTNIFSPVSHDSVDSLGSLFSSHKNISLATLLVSVLITLVIIACIISLRKKKSLRVRMRLTLKVSLTLNFNIPDPE